MLNTPLVGVVLGFLGLPRALTDPWGYVHDKLLDLYHSLDLIVQQWIVSPPHPVPGAWRDYLYANAVGLALYTVFAIAMITIITMLIVPRYAAIVAKAGLVAFLLGGFYPIWFKAGDYFTDIGKELGGTFLGNSKTDLLFLPDIHNVLGAIGGIFVLLLLGGLLLLIFFGYEVLFVLAMVLGLPLLALAPLGDAPKRRFEQMTVIVIVTSFFGRLAAIGILGLTTKVILHTPYVDNAFGAVLALIVGLAGSIYAQWWLLKNADKIYGKMTGRTIGTSKVTGRLETWRRDRSAQGDMARIQSIHNQSVLGSSGSAVKPTSNPAILRVGSDSVSSSSTFKSRRAISPRSHHEAAWSRWAKRRQDPS